MLALQAQAGPFGPRGPKRKGLNTEEIGKRAALREDGKLDNLDTQKWKKDPNAGDKRSTVLSEYHNHTLRRIVALLGHGAITEENGRMFKEKHTEITNIGKSLNQDGKLDERDKGELRMKLDGLNDAINTTLEYAEESSKQTPLLTQAQQRFEEKIDLGLRSGRLTEGEASRLTRMVEKLKQLEERQKDGGLTTREREKIYEEVAELARDINKELMD